VRMTSTSRATVAAKEQRAAAVDLTKILQGWPK
jgi:hypothetical protein